MTALTPALLSVVAWLFQSGTDPSCPTGLAYRITAVAPRDDQTVIEHRIENCSPATTFWISDRRLLAKSASFDFVDVEQIAFDAAGGHLPDHCAGCVLGGTERYRRLRPGEVVVIQASAFGCHVIDAGHRYRIRAVWWDRARRRQPGPAGTRPYLGPLVSNEIMVRPTAADLALQGRRATSAGPP